MRDSLLLAALAAAASCLGCAQDILGDWHAALNVDGTELRLVLHIAKAESGFKASLDSVDQGADGIPVTSMSLTDSKLSFTIESIGGSYEGKVGADGALIKGTWTQGGPSPLDFKRGPLPPKSAAKPAAPSDIDGAWQGSLDVGQKLSLVLHIINTADGLTGTLDSPDQKANGIPVASVARNGSSVTFDVKTIAAHFEGKLDKDLTTLDGAWTQGGNSWPLVLKRVKVSERVKTDERRVRPQDPVKPYPYRDEDVTYENKVAGITLAATLTVPQGKGPFPAALLITGSGPQDRNEALLGHRPFLVLSDYLTRKGIAVLRADDRGTAKSGGKFATATTADFATDVEAAIAYLKTRSEVNPHKIGLIGHSEGGVIAPMVAARNPDVAFIVMMAGTAVRGDEILVAQGALIAAAGGAGPEKVEKNAVLQRKALTAVEQETDDAALQKRLHEILAGIVPEAQIAAQIKTLTSPWFRYFLTYDPAPALMKVKCPVLAINGEKDLQVPPKMNLPAIQKALETGGNKDFEVEELPGLNHLFQTAKTGAPSEYAAIDETISPLALEKISSWILKHET